MDRVFGSVVAHYIVETGSYLASLAGEVCDVCTHFRHVVIMAGLVDKLHVLLVCCCCDTEAVKQCSATDVAGHA